MWLGNIPLLFGYFAFNGALLIKPETVKKRGGNCLLEVDEEEAVPTTILLTTKYFPQAPSEPTPYQVHLLCYRT